MGNIKALNVLRGVAVLAILVRHAWGLFGSPDIQILNVPLSPFINQMSAAVDLFFVLSGVVLAISYISNGADLNFRSQRNFLLSRLIRIGPAYWIALTLVLVFYAPQFIEAEQIYSSLGLHRFLVFIGFAQQFDPIAFGAFSPLSPFWTLSVEMVFYLLIPVLVKFVRAVGISLSLLLSLIGAAAWLLFVSSRPTWILNALASYCAQSNQDCGPDFLVFMLSHQIPAYLFHFVAGIAIGLTLVRGKNIVRSTARTFVTVGLGTSLGWMWVLGGLSIKNQYWDPFNYIKLQDTESKIYFFGESIVYGAAFAALALGLVYLKDFRTSWLQSSISFYGKIGYSVYLLHMPLLFALIRTDFFQILANAPFRVVTLPFFTLLVITGVSYIYYRAVEAPMHEYARSFSRASKAKVGR